MREKIEHVEREIAGIVLSTKQGAEAFRIQYLGAKGVLKVLYQEFKTIGAEEKKEIGQRLNELKQHLEQKLSVISWEETGNQETHNIDFTRPGKNTPVGSLHPLTLVRN